MRFLKVSYPCRVWGARVCSAEVWGCGAGSRGLGCALPRVFAKPTQLGPHHSNQLHLCGISNNRHRTPSPKPPARSRSSAHPFESVIHTSGYDGIVRRILHFRYLICRNPPCLYHHANCRSYGSSSSGSSNNALRHPLSELDLYSLNSGQWMREAVRGVPDSRGRIQERQDSVGG